MSTVFDLHCDTLTAFMTPGRCLDTLNDPQSAFALCRLPRGRSWAQCCAIFVPDSLPEGDVFPFFHTQVESFRRQGARFADRARICRTAGEAAESWRAGRTARVPHRGERGGAGPRPQAGGGAGPGGSGDGHPHLERRTRSAPAVSTDHGLTAFGRAVVPALELSRQGILAGCLPPERHRFPARDGRSPGRPFVATHSNARAFAPTGGTSPTSCPGDRPAGRTVGLNYHLPLPALRRQAGGV